MRIHLDPNSIDDYRRFLQIKTLPVFRIRGREAWFPDEYAKHLGLTVPAAPDADYSPSPFLFDYQRDISRLAIRKRKFALFVDPGYGKTLIETEFARHAAAVLPPDRCVLMLTPLMVIEQFAEEYAKFYGDGALEVIKSNAVGKWLSSGTSRIGLTNWECLKNDFPRGRLGAIVADESGIIRQHYGKYGRRIIELGKGLEWKLAGTGTPAPNDRIEYANHAVFLDHYPTINSFLAKYFINRGQTQNRWELKPHAIEPFYRDLSHWCIFLTNPATYGWKDNAENIPPIHVHIHDVEMTASQHAAARKLTGDMFAANPGGIGKRSKLSRIAKGLDNSSTTLKYDFIRELISTWPNESTIIWAWFNDEQDRLEREFPDAASISGATKHERRVELIRDFKEGRKRILISKSKILGLGLNLQVATRHVFSSLIDSFEAWFQCIKRSNRVGSTVSLNVHLPVLDIERPMIETVLRKAQRVEQDTKEQERIFHDSRII